MNFLKNKGLGVFGRSLLSLSLVLAPLEGRAGFLKDPHSEDISALSIGIGAGLVTAYALNRFLSSPSVPSSSEPEKKKSTEQGSSLESKKISSPQEDSLAPEGKKDSPASCQEIEKKKPFLFLKTYFSENPWKKKVLLRGVSLGIAILTAYGIRSFIYDFWGKNPNSLLKGIKNHDDKALDFYIRSGGNPSFSWGMEEKTLYHILAESNVGGAQDKARVQRIIKTLKNSGCQIDENDRDQMTPLARAVTKGNKEVASLLLEEGANPLLKNWGRGGNLFHLIAQLDLDLDIKDKQERFKEIITLLKDKGLSLQERDQAGMTPLFKAVREGRVEATKLFLGMERNLPIRNKGETLLHFIARVDIQTGQVENFKKIIRILKDKGADIGAMDEEGMTPVILAIKGRKVAALDLLLEGENPLPLVPGTKGGTLLHFIGMMNIQPKHRGDFKKIIRILKDKGAHIGAMDAEGMTPVAVAVKEGQEVALDLLLEGEKTLPLGPGTKGETLLHFITRIDIRPQQREPFKKIIQILKDKGADIEAKDAEGMTPVALAVKEGQEVALDLLLEGEKTLPLRPGTKGGMLLHSVGRIDIRPGQREDFKKIIQILKDKGADIGARDGEGMTPVALAVKEGQATALELLVEGKKTLPLGPGTKGGTLLHFMAKTEIKEDQLENFKKIIDILWLKRLCFSDKDEEGMTPLLRAIEGGNVEVVTAFLESGKNFILDGVKRGHNLLHSLSLLDIKEKNREKITRILKILKSKGLSINVESFTMPSPIAYAVKKGNAEVVKLFLKVWTFPYLKYGLLSENLFFLIAQKNIPKDKKQNFREIIRLLKEHGLNINERNSLDYLPLYHAVFNKNKRAVKLLLQGGADACAPYKSDNKTLFHLLAENNSFNMFFSNENTAKIIHLLTKHNLDVDQKNEEGLTPLSLAIQEGNLEAVKFLLEAKADLSLVRAGSLIRAIERCNWQMLESLLKVNPLRQSYGSWNQTLFHLIEDEPREYPQRKNFKKIINLLIDLDHDVNAVDKRGITPLYQAVSTSNVSFTKVLLKRGANPSVMTDTHPIPLISLAVKRRCYHIVRRLLRAGVSPNIHHGKLQKTPLHLACMMKRYIKNKRLTKMQSNVVKILIKKGANLNALDNQGRTPLSVFLEFDANNKKVINLFLSRPSLRLNWGKGLSRFALNKIEKIGLLSRLVEKGAFIKADELLSFGKNKKSIVSLLNQVLNNKNDLGKMGKLGRQAWKEIQTDIKEGKVQEEQGVRFIKILTSRAYKNLPLKSLAAAAIRPDRVKELANCPEKVLEMIMQFTSDPEVHQAALLNWKAKQNFLIVNKKSVLSH